MTTSTLSSSRPSAKERADVEKQRSEVVKTSSEKRIPVIADISYFKRLQEIKSCTDASIKLLMIEAMDDLFLKYGRGEGRNKPDDVAELKRRLLALK